MDRGVVIADTDVFLDFLEGEGAHEKVAALLRAGRLTTTAVTVFEIWRGLESGAELELARRALRGVAIYPLSVAAARRAAEVHRLLRGDTIGERDTLIAGICLCSKLPLLSANVRHFRRVPGLEVIQAR